MGKKKLLQEYFRFSRQDRIAVLVLAGIIMLVFLLPALVRMIISPLPLPVDTAWITAARQLQVSKPADSDEIPGWGNQEENASGSGSHNGPDYPGGATHLFLFDPNTLSALGWSQLGLREKTVHIILNYLAKGGHFRKPEDLQKIYGLRSADYKRLLPFIRITEKTGIADSNAVRTPAPALPKQSPYLPVDINTADTAAFIALPGIGSKLASRIVSFRDKIGGFYTINQIAEVYGIADSVFKKICPFLKISYQAVKKININTATAEELKKHPYIRYNIANALIAYRNEHGAFIKIEDIRNIMLITPELYSKIVPYLTIE